jgi:hypothetical protein
LSVDIDYHSSVLGLAVPGCMGGCALGILGGGDWSFLHKIESEFSSEFDEAIVACFGDYEYGLNL